MDDQPKNGSSTDEPESGPQPLTDAQKLYASRFRDWLLMLSREDFTIAVNNVLQPLKAAYYNRKPETEDVSRPS